MSQDQVANLMDLEDKFRHIRTQINSKLENQKHVAIILEAVDENIREQQKETKIEVIFNSSAVTNYLLSFLSILDQAVDQETREIKDLQLATSALYLLDIIFQYTPKKLLRSKFVDLLTKIAPCITDENSEAPIIRSAIGCLESLLVAQDNKTWVNKEQLNINPMRGLNAILELSLDGRPKIRKRSLDALHKILSNPPPPMTEHIISKPIADYSINALVTIVEENEKTQSKETSAMQIHICKLYSTIISTNQWPTSKLDNLIGLLLEVVKKNNGDTFLVSNVFQVFDSIFANENIDKVKLNAAMASILKLKPSIKDTIVATSWIGVIQKGCITLSKVSQEDFFYVELANVFRLMSEYLSSETASVNGKAATCLISIVNFGIQQSFLIDEAQDEMKIDQTVGSLANIIQDFLSSIRFSHSLPHVLHIATALISKLSLKSAPAFLPCLEIVGKWRSDENNSNQYVSECEQFIGASIQSLGPEKVLKVLPLNLGENANPNDHGRAWLLPLIRDNTKYAELATFIREFIPLITFFESKCEKLPEESIELRLFQTVVDQLWSTLPHFCWLPKDLTQSFSNEFASELSSFLYSKVDLRNTICHALRNIVTSNQEPVVDLVYKEDFFPEEVLASNLQYFSQTKAANILSVLFNVFAQTTATKRGFLLETIECYLKITSAEDLTKTFNNVCAMLKDALEKEDPNSSKRHDESKVSATLLDLVVTMAKYVPPASYDALFAIFNTTVASKDPLIQKRSYRIMSKLSELSSGTESISSYIGDIENVMFSQQTNCLTSARASRLSALKTVVELLPLQDLHFIVNVAPEVILCTRDVNEKTRETAFQILILMAKAMQASGSVIDLSKVASIPSDEKVPGDLMEFFKIIAAGMIGESQHMVTATITAYSCLVFEFKDVIDKNMLWEIYDTVELYLTSNSREIVKSAIGFTKVVVLTFPADEVREKVPQLLPKLLRWSHEHTGHFKSKIKHIIERLVRRFGEEFMEQIFPEEDRKLLSNIKKQRNRNKKKGVADEEEEEKDSKTAEAPVSTKGSRFMSAFDDVMYSDSDSDDDGEFQEFDEEGNKKKNKKSQQYIMENKENPLDLLDAKTLSHISSSRPKKYDSKRASKKEDYYQKDADGKLILNDGQTNKDEDDPLSSLTSGVNAYLEAVKQGPIRGQKNRLKFKKTKNNEADDFSDDEGSGKKPEPFAKKSNDFARRGGRVGKKPQNKFKARRKL